MIDKCNKCIKTEKLMTKYGVFINSYIDEILKEEAMKQIAETRETQLIIKAVDSQIVEYAKKQGLELSETELARLIMTLNYRYERFGSDGVFGKTVGILMDGAKADEYLRIPSKDEPENSYEIKRVGENIFIFTVADFPVRVFCIEDKGENMGKNIDIKYFCIRYKFMHDDSEDGISKEMVKYDN